MCKIYCEKLQRKQKPHKKIFKVPAECSNRNAITDSVVFLASPRPYLSNDKLVIFNVW